MKRLQMTSADLGELARLVRKVEFFAPMTVGQLEMVLPYILLCEYPAGEKVFKQGAGGDAFYIVQKGKLSVLVSKGWFTSSEVAKLGPGDFFGEMALLSDARRSATVACLEYSRLFVLMSADFKFVLRKNPQFAAEVQRIADRRKFLDQHEK
ncbi:MAG: hypothetical protein A2X36_13350 [Elusimicrobia bacterium GWA2_69_24]|nr:MAG: hypothetical protein A2X36_13350 [Elusimicrobia bacterium GWA2_69_24]HBL15752.1 hypothetical protein [Elusimicrobiota bacterium]